MAALDANALPMRRNLDRLLRDFIAPPAGVPAIDFAAPAGAMALFAPDSLSWRVMKNPVALTIGGIAAVILELAEPRVRSGVWEHTSFRTDPTLRMRRTGYAAMATIYAPAAAARALIEGVNRTHARVAGVTPQGQRYRADEEMLLNWVHATAQYGFFEAYSRFVRRLSNAEFDQLLAEGGEVAALYGAHSAPRTWAQMQHLFSTMQAQLERTEILFAFLDLVRSSNLLPSRSLQRLCVRGAIDITPDWARTLLELGPDLGLRPGEHLLLKSMGAVGERFVLAEAPPARASLRMGLPADYLYRGIR